MTPCLKTTSLEEASMAKAGEVCFLGELGPEAK